MRSSSGGDWERGLCYYLVFLQFIFYQVRVGIRGGGDWEKVCFFIYFFNICIGSLYSIVSVFQLDVVSIIFIFFVGFVVIIEMVGYVIVLGVMNFSIFFWVGLGIGFCLFSVNVFNQVCIFDCKCLKKKKIFFFKCVSCDGFVLFNFDFLFFYIELKLD